MKARTETYDENGNLIFTTYELSPHYRTIADLYLHLKNKYDKLEKDYVSLYTELYELKRSMADNQ